MDNIGNPSDDDKEQVKLNQNVSGDNAPPLPTGPSPTPNPVPPPPPVPPGPNPPKSPAPPIINPVGPPPAVPPPPPITPAPISPPPAIPSTPPSEPQAKEDQNIGVGRPNIGVELEDKKSATFPEPEEPATITTSSSEVEIPGVKPPAPSPKPPSNTDQPPQPATTPAPAVPPPPQPDEPPFAEATSGKPALEFQASDIPIKRYDQSKIQTPGPTPTAPVSPTIQPPANQPPSNRPLPPIKAGSSGPASTIAVLAILALIFGGAGGFFGFRYYDKIKTSASTEVSPSPSSTDQTGLKTYTSTKYKFTLSYPNDWQSNNPTASSEKIVFASNKESLEGTPAGERVDIVFQDSQGQTLKKWVEANAAATIENKPIKEITVDGQTAYQQEQSKNGPAVATYIERPNKVMIVTYSAAQDKYTQGSATYNQIINSIKLE